MHKYLTTQVLLSIVFLLDVVVSLLALWSFLSSYDVDVLHGTRWGVREDGGVEETPLEAVGIAWLGLAELFTENHSNW